MRRKVSQDSQQGVYILNQDGSVPVWNNMFEAENFSEYSWNPPNEIRSELRQLRTDFCARSPKVLLANIAATFGLTVRLTDSREAFAPLQGKPFAPTDRVLLADVSKGLFCI